MVKSVSRRLQQYVCCLLVVMQLCTTVLADTHIQEGRSLLRDLKQKETPAQEVDADQEESVTGLFESAQCLCIFDFDNTLFLIDSLFRPWKGKVAGDAKAVVAKCAENGYGIGVASANPGRYIKRILQKDINGTIFSDAFLDSDAFQQGQPLKNFALENVLDFYGVDNDKCAMFFDDTFYNRVFSFFVKLIFQKVDGDDGVTLKDLEKASKKIPDGCGCQPIGF